MRIKIRLAITLATILFVACFLTLSACQPAASPMTPADLALIRADIDEAFKGLALAAQTVDIESYLDYFDKEHFTALNADGTVTHSMGDFEAVARQSFAAIKSYSSLDFSNVKITVVNRTTAILVNEYQAEVVLESGDSFTAAGAGSQVWSKSTDRWQLVSVSSSDLVR